MYQLRILQSGENPTYEEIVKILMARIAARVFRERTNIALTSSALGQIETNGEGDTVRDQAIHGARFFQITVLGISESGGNLIITIQLSTSEFHSITSNISILQGVITNPSKNGRLEGLFTPVQ
jgi:hypothetical protein